MTVNHLWEIIHEVAHTRLLTEFAVYELSTGRIQDRDVPVIGINAMDLIHNARRSPSNIGAKNPELRSIAKEIVSLEAVFSKQALVFVFDGRLTEDNGESDAHWMEDDVQRMIKGYQCDIHIAPENACAELAYLNREGFVDFVYTSNSDVFVFGATDVIRRPEYTPTPQLVEIYTRDALASHSTGPLGRTEFLFLAVLLGSDYDQGGLKGFGPSLARTLCHSGHARLLDNTVTTSSRRSLAGALSRWRAALRKELAKDPHGIIGRRLPHVAHNITTTFPSVNTLLQYARPRTSEFSMATRPNPGAWAVRLPDTEALCSLFCELFNCQGVGAINTCRELIWEGLSVRQLAQNTAGTLPLNAGLGLTAMTRVTDMRFDSPGSLSYEVEFYGAGSVVRSVLDVLSNRYPDQPRPFRRSLVRAWVPVAILQRVAQGHIVRYHLDAGSFPPPVGGNYAPILPDLAE